jgi:hypothetical protein
LAKIPATTTRTTKSARSLSRFQPKMFGRSTASVVPPPRTSRFPKTRLSMRIANASVSNAR